MLDTYTGSWKQNRRKYSDDMDIKKQINDLEAEIYACNSFLKLFLKSSLRVIYQIGTILNINTLP